MWCEYKILQLHIWRSYYLVHILHTLYSTMQWTSFQQIIFRGVLIRQEGTKHSTNIAVAELQTLHFLNVYFWHCQHTRGKGSLHRRRFCEAMLRHARCGWASGHTLPAVLLELHWAARGLQTAQQSRKGPINIHYNYSLLQKTRGKKTRCLKSRTRIWNRPRPIKNNERLDRYFARVMISTILDEQGQKTK